jgi:hypothetical protein
MPSHDISSQMTEVLPDGSNGDETGSREFMDARIGSAIGADVGGEWAKQLPIRASIRDLGRILQPMS